jgi:hypothetical protein
LIELLMVVLILPVIMGALVAAILVSIDNSKTISNRLSDSADSQITSAYYVRDVQGAGFVTTTANIPTPYSYQSPQVCPASAPGSLIVGLYHDATASGPALDVGYWLVGGAAPYQVVRYSCTVSPSTGFAATAPVHELVAENVSSVGTGGAPSPNAASIQPSQFGTAAKNGWTSTVASTYLQSWNTTSVTVKSTNGFNTSAPEDVNVATALGTQLLTNCNVTSSTVLTCSNVSSVNLAVDQTVSQDSITGVNLAIRQSPANPVAGSPKSEYTYSLTAAPRSQTPWGAGPGTSPVGGPGGGGSGGGSGGGGPAGQGLPALLSLGTAGISLGGTTNLNFLNGSAGVADGGPISCIGNSSISPPGSISDYPSASGCSSSAGSFVPDPLVNYLPSCFPTQPNGTYGPVTHPDGTTTNAYRPGRYTSTILPNNVHGTYYFEPGVYELDGGIAVGSNQGIAIDPYYASSGQGVLLYVPDAAPTNPAPGCAYASSGGATISLGAQGAANLPPLTASQLSAESASNPTLTFLQPLFNRVSSLGSSGIWIWQDASNSSPADLGGGSSASSPGLAYLPAAPVTLHGGPGSAVGEIICASLTLVGNGTVSVSG